MIIFLSIISLKEIVVSKLSTDNSNTFFLLCKDNSSTLKEITGDNSVFKIGFFISNFNPAYLLSDFSTKFITCSFETA